LAAPDAISEGEVRAGSLVLALFANPLNALILRAHAEGPLRLAGLHEKMGWAAHTTLRAALTNLGEIGALVRPEGGSRFAVENELTPAGREMLFAADVVEAWLARAPDGPIALESEAAKGAIKSLGGGWGSTLMRALANRAFTLTELDSLIPGVSYPSLERRIARMRATGQIEPVQAGGRGTPYVVTEWLRRSIAPLCAAGRCERRHLPDKSAPITNVEVEASFMLAVPLVSLPKTANGTCMLAVQAEAGETGNNGRNLAGVTVEVERGEVVSCAARVNETPPTWALGTAEEWLDVVIDGDLETLRFGGARPQLALDLVSGLHFALFGG
jgi:DNA-binding HxlR family transcriptional regulator